MPRPNLSPPLRRSSTVPCRSRRTARGRVGSCAVVLAALATAGACHAAPAGEAKAAVPTAAPVPDAVWNLLQQRGLVAAETAEPAPAVQQAPASTTGLARRWRDAAAEAVVTAVNFLGVPYRAGGRGADEGFDCSGFTRHVFQLTLGRLLPRRADEQARDASLTAVAREQLRPGDLVFFNTLQRAFSHVGIYIGEDRFIHSPRAGSVVRIEDMRQAYWAQRFDGARRADVADAPPSAQP